jgi:hypothetical protein
MSNESIATQVYNLLVEMGNPAKLAESAIERANAKLQGAYDMGMNAARIAGDWATFQPIIEQLEDNIRKNVDNLAVRFGAPKRDEEDKNGNKYKIPSSVSNVKSRVKKAFENGVSLEDSDGNARSYTEVKDELQAIATANKEANEAAAVAELTGEDAVRHEVTVLCAQISESVKNVSGSDLAELVTVLRNLTGNATESEDTASELEAAAA